MNLLRSFTQNGYRRDVESRGWAWRIVADLALGRASRDVSVIFSGAGSGSDIGAGGIVD